MPLSEYTLRMNRVLDHIDRHLDQPLDLDTLADVAYFSRFHFHRVFAAWVGETFGDYLRRRRLETAAWMLTGQPATPVLTIALSVGFGSSEAFSRAFKMHFGHTPSAWRAEARSRCTQNSNTDQFLRNSDQATRRLDVHNGCSFTSYEEPHMDIQIAELPAVKVAYLRYIGVYGPPIGEFWRKEAGPWMAANGLLGRGRFGIGYDNPDVTPADKCRYDACVAVPDDFDGRGKFNVATLPGGRYAVAKFHGDPTTIAAAWNSIFDDWLPASGFQVDARPCFEYYASDFDHDLKTVGFRCDICVPVKPL
jgi:AraC family transcriptional regulator